MLVLLYSLLLLHSLQVTDSTLDCVQTLCKWYPTLLRNNSKGQSACPLEMQFSLDTFGQQLVESPDAEPWLWRAGCTRLQSRVERRAPRNLFSFKLSSRRVTPASSVVCLCCCHSWFLSNHLPVSTSSCSWVYGTSAVCRRSCLASGPGTCRWRSQLADPDL